MISTAPVVVCSKCGQVSHIEGTVQPSVHIHSVCPGAGPATPGARHAWKTVIVMVPYA